MKCFEDGCKNPAIRGSNYCQAHQPANTLGSYIRMRNVQIQAFKRAPTESSAKGASPAGKKAGTKQGKSTGKAASKNGSAKKGSKK